jgi:NAD(P)-dependent dehydrogenase (short-subunit alcohol dehydrogenase family)
VHISFSGKTVLVLGAAGGMGRQICIDLKEAGANLVATDVRPSDDLENLASLTRITDASDPDAIAEVVAATLEQFGALHAVVNTVGVLWFDRDVAMADIALSVWRDVMTINLLPMVGIAKHAVPAMRQSGGGAMVHISSTDALGGDDKPQDAYGAAKAAMLRMSKSLAIQYAADGIRSNVILPGSIQTPMQDRWKTNPQQRAAIEAAVPLGRVGTPEDISAAALFLLSDQASYITGAELIVDGGWRANA